MPLVTMLPGSCTHQSRLSYFVATRQEEDDMIRWLLCAAAIAAASVAHADTVPTEGVLYAEGGRFVFGQTSQARRDQYLLDTKTGQL